MIFGSLRCISPLLALSGHPSLHRTCPLLGAKRTCLFALHMSAYDPKRTCFLETISSKIVAIIRRNYLLMIVNGRGEQFNAPISCRFGDH